MCLDECVAFFVLWSVDSPLDPKRGTDFNPARGLEQYKKRLERKETL